MCGKTKDNLKSKNEGIYTMLRTTPIEDKRRESLLKWFGHFTSETSEYRLERKRILTWKRKGKVGVRSLKLWIE